MGTSHKSKALLKRDTPLIHRPSELSFTSISTLGIHGVEYDLDDILGEENENLNKDEWNTGNRSRKSKSKPRSASNVCSDPGCDVVEELSNLCIQSQHQDYNSDNSNGEKKLDSFPERHRRKSFVSFSTIETRVYETILGDNPSCSCGAPLSLGWEYDETKTTCETVNDYELRRGKRSIVQSELSLSKLERQKILYGLGYTRKEVTDVVRSMLKLKKQRRQTVNNISLTQVEEIFEGASKQLSRIIRKRRGSKHLYKEWKGAVDDNDDFDNESIGSSVKSAMKRSISATEDASDFLSLVLDRDDGMY